MKTRKKKKVAPESGDTDGLYDDTHLHVRRIPDPLFAPAPPIVETVFFSRVGHTFGALPTFPGGPKTFIVQDFLLDQTGASGADGKLSGTKLFDLTTTTSYRFEIFPKNRAKLIRVLPPPSVRVFMGLDVGRRFVNAVSDISYQIPAQSFFVNLTGNIPAYSYNYFFIGRNTNHWLEFRVNAELVSPIDFSGLTTTGTYPPRAFDPGIKSYRPYSQGLPFNLPGPNPVPYLVFTYTTDNSIDPGPFVFLS